MQPHKTLIACATQWTPLITLLDHERCLVTHRTGNVLLVNVSQVDTNPPDDSQAADTVLGYQTTSFEGPCSLFVRSEQSDIRLSYRVAGIPWLAEILHRLEAMEAVFSTQPPIGL